MTVKIDLYCPGLNVGEQYQLGGHSSVAHFATDFRMERIPLQKIKFAPPSEVKA